MHHSPVKQKADLESSKDGAFEAFYGPSFDESSGTDLLEEFPTSNKTVWKSFLKEMMLALHSSLHKDFSAILNKFTAFINDFSERANHVEVTMGEFSKAHNGLVQ